MTTYWAPLLHIYQPPTQDIKILKEINKECYKSLFSVLEQHDNAKFTLNINGVLIDMLYDYDLGDTLELLKNLASESKIEIVGTAKFHPILPLIPQKEAHHQIQMNEEINKREFGNIWERRGFFPPELAISSKIAKIVRAATGEYVKVCDFTVDERSEGRVVIEISEDEMKAFMTLVPPKPRGRVLDIDDIHDALGDRNVIVGIMDDVILKCIEEEDYNISHFSSNFFKTILYESTKYADDIKMRCLW